MKRIIIAILVLIVFAISAHAGPNITLPAPSGDITTAVGVKQTFEVFTNETVNVTWYINGTPVGYSARIKKAAYDNSSGVFGYWNVSAYINNSNGAESRQWNWTVKTAPTFSGYAPTTTQNDLTGNTTRFNISSLQAVMTTWYLDGVPVQTNTSGVLSNYTNFTALKGTHNVSAYINNTNGSIMNTWSWVVSDSVISNVSVYSNLSTSERVYTSSNSTLNFTFTDSGNITYINFTLSSDFKFSELIVENIDSGGFASPTLTKTAATISLYSATGLGFGTTATVNISTNLTAPATAGDYNITITTNRNNTGTNVTLYVRDATKPFFVKANNSVFTYINETIGARSVNLSLSGKGVANLTFYVPNLTETNMPVGYGATNVTSLRANHSSGTTPNNTIWVTTDGSVTNPVIVLGSVKELQSSNIPRAIITGGAILAVVYLYTIRRRTR